MKAIEFPEVNVRIAENQPEYETLPVNVQSDKESDGYFNQITMCFDMAEECPGRKIRKVQKNGGRRMTFQTPTWQKQIMTCDCGKPFKPVYRNGILVSRNCPNCNLKALQKEAKSKQSRFNSNVPDRAQSGQKRQKTDRQKWMDKADKIFSQYIRVKFSFQSGGELFCHDIITGKLYHIKNIDNGHCFSRAHKATRFEEDNCRPQNRSSNRFSGEKDHYKFIKNLRAQIGEERFSRIEKLKDSTGDDSETFYRLQYETYKFMLDELLQERRIENPWKK